MAKKMLIDANHPEETRVVVLSGNRLEDFDYESASRKTLKGNIYLAKVTRVEPSLQAAFVDYGGNRHGFLPFSEIHPDYYRIPIADREALIAAEAALRGDAGDEDLGAEMDEDEDGDNGADAEDAVSAEATGADAERAGRESEPDPDADGSDAGQEANGGAVEELVTEPGVDTLGGDEVEDAARRRAKLMRRYKIQEVIKRRQILLVQVTKEERGNKGAALTTYLSLAGRYCVLMPNTAKGGGISRKISNAKDRRRLKSILEDLHIPEGVAVIVRTAGSERTKAEIRRDYEYLLRLWDDIRSTTLSSTAPALIHEEANLVKRSIRDLYQSDIDEIQIEGEDGYKTGKAFMKSLMPSHARKVKQYKDERIPLFYSEKVESQIDAMHNAVVQLKSGGYLVINMTEALVAIDVNSGKATRERHIEETAYRTNLEAADEAARQLRLRDLAGLIVIDFIDMEESRHNRGVERRLKEAMRSDRARIQLGRISPFGLLEMSRQRLRPSLFESSTEVCPSCNATGFVRTTVSVALHIIRGLEEEGIRRGAGELVVSAPQAPVLHLLNHMRDRLVELEERYGLRVQVTVDDTLVPPDYGLQRRAAADGAGEAAPVRAARAADGDGAERKHGRGRRRAPSESAGDEEAARESETEAGGERKRGRGRRRRKRSDVSEPTPAEIAAETAEEEPADEALETSAEADEGEAAGEEKPKRRRRGKRGGRRRSRRPAAAEGQADESQADEGASEAPEDSEAAEESEEAPERGRRRRRKPRAALAADEAETQTARTEAAETPEEEEQPEPARRDGPEEAPAMAAADGQDSHGYRGSEAPGPSADAGSHTADDTANAPSDCQEEMKAPETSDQEEDEENRPRRRGWWQRWG